MTVNFERLRDDIQALANIGKGEDQGIYRMAFSEDDMRARAWLRERIEEGGLDYFQDGAANVFGRVNTAEDVPSVLIGSHIDTVPCGGHLDGALGVMVGLECLRRIKEENINTRYGLEFVAFSDEEGRFGGPFGSQALCGEINPELIGTTTDLNGIYLTEAMEQHGLDPMEALHARRNRDTVHAYLEMHIEQGPVLDRKRTSIGLVTAFTGLFKWFIRLKGNADHAGTTPMPMRIDALGGLSEFSTEIPRILEENGGENSVATIGKIDLFPGTANTVPGEVEFSLDVRDPSADTLAELALAFRKALSAIARRRNLMFEFDILSELEPVPCDPEIYKTIKQTADSMQLSYLEMPSGAVHDAQIMTRLTRVGMIFVPSKDGRSHSPAEWTHWEDIETGANLTLNSLLTIAEAR
ncbi:hydantoinase/carbamoylase family amidase [candidate division GN15 bacterium]|nr:hydantoinase/carbamoylase family amidase [candidate division GN15 bacterium]